MRLDRYVNTGSPPISLIRVTILSVIEKIEPVEVYYLATQSRAGFPVQIREYISDFNALGCLGIWEAIRMLDLPLSTKYCQVSALRALKWLLAMTTSAGKINLTKLLDANLQ